jgi:hypothetical protein
MARKKKPIHVSSATPKIKVGTRFDPATLKALKLAAVEAGESIEATIARAVEAHLRRR